MALFLLSGRSVPCSLVQARLGSPWISMVPPDVTRMALGSRSPAWSARVPVFVRNRCEIDCVKTTL
ncbi:hypothetical protein DPMN_168240 [Dreissena polymorpha]|uniref:Uncharacterized protein n=1 Tax=Dreissena polymorpha TaxID=45954 RepID=A0A9D4F0A4_DREPO|nr:hypothetical protein DPMN_168240 [Dreissena polymorpha]